MQNPEEVGKRIIPGAARCVRGGGCRLRGRVARVRTTHPPKRGTSTPAQAATARRRRATTPTAPRASRHIPEGSGTAAPNSGKAAEVGLTPVGAGLPTTSSKMNLSTSMRPNSPENRPVATTSNHPGVAAPPLTPVSWRVKEIRCLTTAVGNPRLETSTKAKAENGLAPASAKRPPKSFAKLATNPLAV